MDRLTDEIGSSIMATSSFNPLSPRRTRDTRTGASARSLPVPAVSIRSRPEGREIQLLFKVSGEVQSRFNPLSPRRTRDTIEKKQLLPAWFQSALAPKDERYPEPVT